MRNTAGPFLHRAKNKVGEHPSPQIADNIIIDIRGAILQYYRLMRRQVIFLISGGGLMEKNPHMPHIPAPWALMGSGYILLYRFTPEFVREKCLVPEPLIGAFRGGLGTVMYVNYLSSDAGPYRELLFIPGKFDFSGRTYYSITRIYVSTPESVSAGRRNWGIPKELASFETSGEEEGTERISVTARGKTVAEFRFRSRSALKLPVTSAMVPSFLRTLAHPGKDGVLLTAPKARGAIAPARTLEVRVDGSLFPPIDQGHRIATVKVPHFFMVFPQAVIA